MYLAYVCIALWAQLLTRSVIATDVPHPARLTTDGMHPDVLALLQRHARNSTEVELLPKGWLGHKSKRCRHMCRSNGGLSCDHGEPSSADGANVTLLPTPVMIWWESYPGTGHITHELLDNFWSVVTWALYNWNARDKFTVVVHPSGSPYTHALWRILLPYYGFSWMLVTGKRKDARTLATEYCARQAAVLYGKERSLAFLNADPRANAADLIRIPVLQHFGLRRGLQPCRIYVYMRGDGGFVPKTQTPARYIHRPERLLHHLYHSNCSQQIIYQLPRTLEEQVRLFHGAGLFVGPEGGYVGNEMWFRPDACFVEIHQENPRGATQGNRLGYNYLVLAGDYADPTKPKYPHGAYRLGGDDPLVTNERLLGDFVQALNASANCRHWLSEDTRPGVFKNW